MALTLVTAPAVEPISLTEAKAHLRVSHSNDDTLISMYIRAAREYVEGEHGFLGRALVTQTWRLTLDEFPTNEIKIPLPPLQSVVNVYYDDSDGNEQTVDSDLYYVDTASEPGWVVPVAIWPTPLDAINAVRIDFIAGYLPTTDSPPDLAGNVPFNIKAAMLLMIADWMENREETSSEPVNSNIFHSGADRLLRRHKIDKSMA
jgi:uncharacterized phiE125 gp8 family phage protein